MEAAAAMAAEFPDSPVAERARFLRARKGKAEAAATMLRLHHEWRNQAIPPPPGTLLLGRGLPPWLTMPEATCAADGTPVVLTLAALCDADAGSPAQYALAGAPSIH
jgi:hypothetical protein